MRSSQMDPKWASTEWRSLNFSIASRQSRVELCIFVPWWQSKDFPGITRRGRCSIGNAHSWILGLRAKTYRIAGINLRTITQFLVAPKTWIGFRFEYGEKWYQMEFWSYLNSFQYFKKTNQMLFYCQKVFTNPSLLQRLTFERRKKMELPSTTK